MVPPFWQQSHAEYMQVNHCTSQILPVQEAFEVFQTKKPLNNNTVLPPGLKREPYLVALLKSEVLFSSTGARNFKKFGTEEEEWSFFLKAVR